MNNKILLILIFLLVSLVGFGGDKYKIKINIKNYQDTSLLLTSYYGNQVILVDTSFTSKPGIFAFEGSEPLPQGIYMAVSNKKIKLFEFIVGEDQHFTLTTDTLDYSMNIFVEGSEENSIFFDYMHFNQKLYFENLDLQERLSQSEKGSKKFLKIQRQIDSVNQLAGDYKLKIIDQHQQLLVSALFNAMREVQFPDSIINSTDSTATYRYYKSHYWDYLNLSDSRLLRTPLLGKKVDAYFNQLVVRHPDSVIAAVDLVINKARPSNEVISWLVWHFTSEYQNPEYMGFDVVFIHLVDEYFAKEEIENLTPSVLENLQDRADKMRPLLLGEEAPNLILIDTTGNYQSFFSLENEYVLLYFWDYDCGICKKESEVLKKFYKDTDLDVEIYAVNVNGDLDKWKSSVIEKELKWVNVNGTRSVTQNFHDLYDTYGTPAIFILDKDRKIIAKKIGAEQVEGFLEYQESLKVK
jgi:thiol-disulfide isomerase/thioredoxin